MKRWLLCALLLPLGAAAEGTHIVLDDGYGSGERFVIAGRVVEAKPISPAKESDSRLLALWRNARMMKNDEREDVALTIQVGHFAARTASDEEGYFRVTAAPEKPLAAGWHTVTAHGKRAQGTGRLLIVPPSNTVGVISDIDDTVLVSDVLDKKKLLKNTFLHTPQQRRTFPGTADFYARLLAQNADPATAPMFYLSASPRQLAGNIAAFLSHHHFPQGVLLTKQLNGNDRDPLLDQKHYKIAKIEAIFAALPWVKFVLVGDDGELDPETYDAIRAKYPQRVLGIYIRKVNSDPKRLLYLHQSGMPVTHDK